ncbi:MAG: MMPL family transporter [Sneathiella sp.]|nr:MMPL family transporter [Sneathiella sp.]
MIDRWISAVIKGRWFVIAITAILVATAGVGIRNLEFKVDYRELFPKNTSYVDDFVRLQDTFITSDTALIVISGKDKPIFNRDTLQAIKSFTRQAWTLPHVSRVDSVTNFQHTKATGDELTIDSLVEKVNSLTDEEISDIKKSMRLNMMPIFLTSLTTGIGFLSMNFSEIPPFKLLGNVVALCVAIAFILSVTFLPALMSVIPMRKPLSNKAERNFLKPLSDFVLRQRIRLFWGLSASSIFFMLFIPNNKINDQFVKFFDPKVEFRHSSDFASEHLSSLYSIEYTFVSPDDGGVYSVQFLKDLELFNDWLLQQDEVQQTMSIVDILKQLNKSMHKDQNTWYRLPDNRELAAQYFLMYELSLPYGLDITNQVDFTKTETRVLSTLKELNTQDMLAFEARANQWIDSHLPRLEYYQSSPTILFSHLGMNNAKSMLIGSIFALLIISTIITFTLRSIRLGVVSIVSNMVPAGLAFGLWGIFVGQIGVSVAIAIGMTLGIVVDNTVHFLSKYLHARRQLRAPSEIAIAYAFSHVGKAILICNLVLIAGFLVLAQSHLRLNAYMGYFTALTFVMALLIDFLLLPPIQMFIDKKVRAT